MSEAAPELRKQHQAFGGRLGFYQHASQACRAPMRFAVFEPPAARRGPVPVVYFLAGLTCTEENFVMKAGALGAAADLGLMLVAPDTSPRDLGLPGETEAWDFGRGAAFYLDATQSPWSEHYRMESYLTRELPDLLARHFPADTQRAGISGHSMGGHGALVLSLRHPQRYRSVSAFAPIAAPSRCPWGQKAFRGYLGEDQAAWHAHDACELLRDRRFPAPPLVDQGTSDEFLATQLHPEYLREACREAGQELRLRLQEGYDHSYYFVASFVAEHLAHHAASLRA